MKSAASDAGAAMAFHFFYVLSLISIVSCGDFNSGKRLPEHKAVSSAEYAQYKVSKCGQISYVISNIGGMTGYFVNESSTSKKYKISPRGNTVQTSLNAITTQNSPKNGCVYSQSDIMQGYEGLIIDADQIKIDP